MIRVGRRMLSVVVVTFAMTVTGGVTNAAQADYSDVPSFSWAPNTTVFSMARFGNVIYLGGGFSALRNTATGQNAPRAGLAALDADTGALLPWNPGANDRVRALAVGPDGVVYAGGDFTTAAGAPASRLAAINPDGSRVAGWSSAANRTVRQIRVDGADVYVAGNFANIDGRRRIGIAKISAATGDLDLGWNANVGSGRVRALTHGPDGTMILGGSFTTLSGEPRSFLGAVSRSTGAVTPWQPESICDSCQLLDLDIDGRNVYAAVGGGGGGRASSWSLDSNSRRWSRGADGDVQAVAVADDGTVYFGGHFGPAFFNNPRHQLARLTTGGTLLGYRLSTTGGDHPGVWDLIAEHDQLHVSGGIQLSNSPQRRYLRLALV